MMDQDRLLFLLNEEIKGTLTAEQRIQLNQILAEDEEAKALYNFLKSKSQSVIKSETDAVFKRIWTEVEKHDSTSSSSLSNLNSTDFIKKQSFYERYVQQNIRFVAAACLILTLCSVILYFSLSIGKDNEKLYFSNKGERKKIELLDGSILWLNSDSKLYVSIDFGKKNRKVRLEGEAFFAVAKDTKLPFIVSYNDAEVKVLGTKFNIRAYPDESQTTTSLVEGSIELKVDNVDDDIYQLKPGQKVEISHALKGENVVTLIDSEEQKERTTSNSNSVPTEALWMENKLSFDQDPLYLVVSKLSKWYNVNIVLENKDLEHKKFNGVMENFTLNQVLQILKAAEPNLKIRREQGKIIIY